MTGDLQETRVGQAVEQLHDAFAEGRVPEARLIAEWLAVEVLGGSRLELPLHTSRPLTGIEHDRLRDMEQRILKGEPVQYVIGHADFMGLWIKTDARALIPRPETEGLVEKALALPAARTGVRMNVADVGTGTGCIAIAVAAQLPAAQVLALDTSRQALALAGENVARHDFQYRIELRHMDLLSGVADASLDLAISNPPYVTRDEWAALPTAIREYEPRSALEAGADGLDAIRRLTGQARRALRPGGILLLEVGAAQGEAVAGLLAEAGFCDVAVTRDLARRERYVQGKTSCSNR